MNDERQSMTHVIPWANPESITGMAAVCSRSGTPPIPERYSDFKSEPYVYAEDMKYVYFEMPVPVSSLSAPGYDHLMTPGGGELVPLLSGTSSSTTPGSTETTTSPTTTSSSSSSYEMPTSIFKSQREIKANDKSHTK